MNISNLANMSTEYLIATSVQALVLIAVGITFVAILAKNQNNMLYRLMLVIVLSTFMQNAGYLQELSSSTVNEALAGIRIEYIGGAFTATLFLALVILYCGYPIPKKLFAFIVTVDVLVLLAVWTCKYHPFYYTSLAFESNARIPHIVLGKSWFYIFNAVLTFLQMFGAAIITLLSFRHVKNPEQRKNYNLLLLSSILPMISYILGRFSIFEGFDPVPIGVGSGVIVLSIAILFHHAFDLVATAHENIFRNLDEAILIVDNHYDFVEANTKAKLLFPELDYRPSPRTPAPEGILSYLFEQEQDSELNVGEQCYRVHKNEIFMEASLSGYVYFLFDVTEERKQFRNMQRLKEEADRANKAKSNFLAHVSHEIRTPINAVLGMNEMILRESTDPETLKYSKDIKAAARTLLSIINDILDTSKLESGKMELVPVDYELNTLLSDVYNMIVIRTDDKQLTLNFDIDPQLPGILRGDDIRIRQILLNLLTNAVKYTNEGTVTLRVSCIQAAKRTEQAIIKYEVTDTGIGIHEDDLPHLYEAFERVDLERNRNIEGTGLGMSIAVKFLNMMGSTLHVESTYGEGSTFSFELSAPVIDPTPIGDFSHGQQLIEKSAEYKVSFIAPQAKVLVVDDNQTNRVVFKALLQQTQVQIQEADSGVACLNAVQKEHFDAIFMDDMMPGMTGRETLQKMQQMDNNLCADTPVVMLTANAIHGEKEKYLALGFDDFLIKPIDPELLEAMLGRILPAPQVRWSVAELDGRASVPEEAPDNTTQADMTLLAQIEGLDINYAKLHLPSDSLLLQTARSFCLSIPQEIAVLQQFIDCISEDEYLTSYRLRAHTIKSSAATIGLIELAGVASLSEAAARSENRSQLQKLHPLLMEQLDICQSRLLLLLASEERSNAPKDAANMTEVLPLLDLLCEALKERDFDAADLLMNKLTVYAYSDKIQEQINLLQSQVMNLEADKACATAQQILRQ